MRGASSRSVPSAKLDYENSLDGAEMSSILNNNIYDRTQIGLRRGEGAEGANGFKWSKIQGANLAVGETVHRELVEEASFPFQMGRRVLVIA